MTDEISEDCEADSASCSESEEEDQFNTIFVLNYEKYDIIKSLLSSSK